MKRVLAILLTAVMLVGTLAACGGSGSKEDSSKDAAATDESKDDAADDAEAQGDTAEADDGEKVKLTMWWGGSDSKAVAWCEYLEETIEAQCPNIDMEVTPIAWSE